MSPRYLRRAPERKDDVAAGAVSAALGVGFGLIAFYFVRLMLTREPLPGGPGGSPDAPRSEE